MDKKIVLVVNDIRSTHNVGSLLRTADGLGIEHVYLTGYTPYPSSENETRLPHIATKLTNKIKKTSLGAEHSVKWTHIDSVNDTIERLASEGYLIVGLEQTSRSTSLEIFSTMKDIALIIGNEVSGIDDAVIKLCNEVVYIPMLGKKESFNVVQATAMALYKFRYFD